MAENKRILFIVFSLVFTIISCYKDNEEAKKLGGTWKMDKFEWAGKDSVPAGLFTDSLGSWQFTVCKSRTETCKGKVNEFFAAPEESFGWYLRSKGTKLTFLPDDIKAGTAQFAGDWNVSELSEHSLVISSESCGSCKVLGKEVLFFSK